MRRSPAVSTIRSLLEATAHEVLLARLGDVPPRLWVARHLALLDVAIRFGAGQPSFHSLGVSLAEQSVSYQAQGDARPLKQGIEQTRESSEVVDELIGCPAGTVA